MKQEITVFKNEKFGEIRTILDKQGEPWFCISDICKILNISNATQLSDRLDDDEKAMLDIGLVNRALVNFTNESGIYKILLRSDKEEAKPFQKWVTSEVLPSIRKTGKYELENKQLEKQKKEEKQLKKLELEERKLVLKEQEFKIKHLKELKESLAKYGEDKIQIIDSKIAEINGLPNLIPLPNIQKEKLTFSATEICKKLKTLYGIDISVQKFGKLSNENNLKIEKYGEFFRDKSKYSDKIVETFRYYESVLEAVKDIISAEEEIYG